MRNLKWWFRRHEIILTLLGLAGAALALFVAVTLTGCASPTAAAETRKMYIVNSLWQVVKIVEVGSREVIGDDINEEIEAYNVETLDDFLRVYYDTVPDLANAPLVNVYICNPATYEVNMSAEGISRQDLIDNIVGWRAASFGQILLIDHVPPLPIVIPPPSMYAWYSLYVIDSDGAIVYEDHCGWLDTEVWDGQWILDAGWRNADHYYETTRRGFWSEVVTHPGWTLVEHQLYTEPTL